MKKVILAALVIAAVFSRTGVAAEAGTLMTRISLVASYNQYGNGDVIFAVEAPNSACSDGYWLAKPDPGYGANLAMVLAAFQAKTSVVVYGLTDQLWAGSSGKYCKLSSVELH